jgi:hypothetical protein
MKNKLAPKAKPSHRPILVPVDLHEKLKIQSAKSGVFIGEYVSFILRESLKGKS